MTTMSVPENRQQVAHDLLGQVELELHRVDARLERRLHRLLDGRGATDMVGCTPSTPTTAATIGEGCGAAS